MKIWALMLLGTVAVAAQKKPDPPKAALHVRSIDRARRVVTVEVVGGPQKAPAANLFTFTDERSRHFVAVSAQCAEPFAPATRSCALEIPLGYERHRLVSLQLHLGSLKGRLLEAPAAEISAAWDASDGDGGESP